MKKKKSRFWTFWFSFLPGCVEMYTGFFKQGLSLMTIFWGIIALATTLDIGPLLYVCIISWLYSFFHARNIADMSEEQLVQIKDDYLFHFSDMESNNLSASKNKILAWGLLLVGSYLSLKTIFDMMSYIFPQSWFMRRLYSMIISVLPRLAVGAGIIFLGVHMIKGKKKEMDMDKEMEEDLYGRHDDK